MNLTGKLILVVALTVSAFSILQLQVVNRHLDSTFESYEDAAVARNTARILTAIEATYARLRGSDWSEWTETYNFAQGENDAYVEENLTSGTLYNLDINFMLVADLSGKVIWRQLESLNGDGELPFDESFLPPHLKNRQDAEADQPGLTYQGLMATSRGLMFIASRPILHSDGSGPPAGSLVMGRFLDSDWVEEITDSTHVEFDVFDMRSTAKPQHINDVWQTMSQAGDHVLITKGKDVVTDYRRITCLNQPVDAVLEVLTTRDIVAQGKNLQLASTGSVMASGLIIMIVITVTLRNLAIRPLQELGSHFETIEKSGELALIANQHRNDEIGFLAGQFNLLVQSLESAEDDNRLMSSIIDRTAMPIAFAGGDGRILITNVEFREYAARIGLQIESGTLEQLFASQDQSAEAYEEMLASAQGGKPWHCEVTWTGEDGTPRQSRMMVMPITTDGTLSHISVLYQDVTELNEMERLLGHAQKMDAVGRLASGIAHEINTPAQYVSDNTAFLKEAFEDLDKLLVKLIEISSGKQEMVAVDSLRSALSEADAEFLREQIPEAVLQSREGVDRIAKIVRAMKNFAHPASERSQNDINDAIQSTATISSNEWKYVADLNLDLDPELPAVECDIGQINQVLLNIIVNAAHALAETGSGNEKEKGRIEISTRHAESHIEIRIADNGPGMPAEVKSRIFDPFFTTKEVGKGTGQGLSIAYDVVVKKHDGSITVESEPGKGTSFIIKLPTGVIEADLPADAMVAS